MYSPLSHIDQEANWTLQELSIAKAATLSASIVYLCVLMIVGVIGNAFVLIIFYFRFSPSTHRTFILTLAFYDFFACAIGAPFTFVEPFFAFTYFDEVSCKILRFVLYYTTVASSLTLVLIAIERCRKICTPMKSQFSVSMAKKAVFVVAGVFSSLSSSPAFALYGNATIATGFRNVTGTKCFIKDEFTETIWPIALNVYLLSLAFISTAIMTICYIQIARSVSKMGKENIAKRMKTEVRDTTAQVKEPLQDSEDECSTIANVESINLQEEQIPNSNVSKDFDKSSKYKEDRTRQKKGKGLRLRLRQKSSRWANNLMRRFSSTSGKKTLRVTKMLTFVTVAFVLSYLPHLMLMIWSLLTDNEHQLPKDNAYQFMFNSFLFNNLVNPFIYAAMDLKFRNELKKLLKCEFRFRK